MINTLKHLSYILQTRSSVIDETLKNLDKYYYKKLELKQNKDGSLKLDSYGNPKERILYPSIGVLKTIQKRIKKNILDKIVLPNYIYGGIKGRDNIKNAKRHQGKKFIFTTDLKNFYPSITNKMVFEMFRSFNFSPTVSRKLTMLTTYKGMLPQGASTSSMIANLVFIKIGSKLQSYSEQNQITFTSFVDDLTFSSPIDFKQKAATILEIIRAQNFKIAYNKTNYKTKFPTVTGLVVKNNNICITKDYKEQLEQNPLASGKWYYAARVLAANKK